ncbi:outer membrane lipoprotein chaperone LolA [Myxococcota bacterium]|nr:outer membrane lipoprotein chaperone LolA [Myxococcota bacterium]
MGLAALLASLAAAPGAAGATAEEVIAQVQRRYGKGQALSARFVQQDTYALGGASTQKGTVTLKHPGKMRWDYTEPKARLFVSDGRELWMWTPDVRQAVHYPSVDPRVTGRIFDFLHGLANVSEDYAVTLAPGDADAHTLEMVPRRPDAGFAKVTLSFDRDDLDLRRAVTVDAVGNLSSTSFTEVRLGVAVEDEVFRFTPPAGAEVIESP